MNDAHVACKDIGKKRAISYCSNHVDSQSTCSSIGLNLTEGSGEIWLDDLECVGDEFSLSDCPSYGIGNSNCGHSEDVGVICSNGIYNSKLK